MQEIKLLIGKFWAGTATDTEKQRLFEWISNNGQEWQRLLENEYRQELNSDLGDLAPTRSQQILEKLHGQIATDLGGLVVREGGQPGKKVRVLRPWMRWAAAAVIIVGIGFGMYRASSGGNNPAVAARQESKATKRLRQQVNKDASIRHIILQDGSAADLYPGGRLSYYEPFDSAARDLSLQGKAVFNVAKCAGAPFTVYAGGFTTTALGTKFMVNTTEDHRMSIVLLEGKVYVHATPQCGMAMKDIYLIPGQELAINTGSKVYTVDNWKAADTGAIAGAMTNKGKAAAKKTPVNYAFVFSRTSLAKVFRQLGDHYKIRIAFSEPDLEGLSFTGKIMQTDDLQVVLSIICNTNDLTFKPENGEITISKQK